MCVQKKDKKNIGGFAAEYERVYKGKNIPKEQALQEAEKFLKISLVGEFTRRYNADQYEYYGITFKTNYLQITKKYGTSLTALAWMTYIFPNY